MITDDAEEAEAKCRVSSGGRIAAPALRPRATRQRERKRKALSISRINGLGTLDASGQSQKPNPKFLPHFFLDVFFLLQGGSVMPTQCMAWLVDR